MSEVVLDASALIALLQRESGADKVEEVIRAARVSTVNYAEVVSHFIRLGATASDIDEMLRPLPIELIAAESDVAREAGRLRALTAPAGLSLGDRFCLALAHKLGLPAFTADRQWRKLSASIETKIILIR